MEEGRKQIVQTVDPNLTDHLELLNQYHRFAADKNEVENVGESSQALINRESSRSLRERDGTLIDMTEAGASADYPASGETQLASTDLGMEQGHLTLDISRDEDERSQLELRHGIVTFKDVLKKEAEGQPYLCVGSDANIVEVCKIMEEEWIINKPTIVLHVITGIRQQGAFSSQRQKENLKEGFIASANKTNMWIVTNGLNCGFVKALGESVSRERRRRDTLTCRRHPKESAPKLPKLTLMGIAREETIRSSNIVLGKSSLELVTPEGESKEITTRYELNPHHTHFIVVKDKTEDETGLEKFVLNFADFLKHPVTGVANNEGGCYQSVPFLAGSKIPMIGLLIGGGFRSTRMVHEYLKNHVPIVVLKGSEGAADLLAFAYEEIKGKRASWDPDYVKNFVITELTQKISMYFEKYRIDSHYRIVFRDILLGCIELAHQNDRVLLTVLDMHDTKCDLSLLNEHLMRAMFRAERRSGMDTHWRYYVKRDLFLAMDWNCPHICELEIFTDDTQIHSIDPKLFECALRREDREDFVDLFLGKGFKVEQYMTPLRLFRLFERAEDPDFFQNVILESSLIMPLSEPQALISDLNGLIYRMAKIRNFVSLRQQASERQDDIVTERRVINALVVYAVLMNRPTLAQVLWKRAPYPIHLGLLISILFKKLADYVSETHLNAELNSLSTSFAKMAIGVLEASYTAHNCRAIDILSEEVSDYDYKTAVEMAATARNRHFIAHPSCQKWLSSLFDGDVAIRDRRSTFLLLPSWLKIALSAFLIFPIYSWIVFKPKKSPVNELYGLYGREGRLDASVHELNKQTLNQTSRNFSKRGAQESFYDRKITVSDSNIHTPNWLTRTDFKRSKVDWPLWKKISTLWNAPVVKFWTHQIFYILYLTLFSITVLWPSCGLFYLDLSLWFWTFLILLEEVYITYMQYKHFSSKRLTSGVLEMFLISGFLITFLFVRIFPAQEVCAWAGYMPTPLFHGYGARVVMCLGLIYFFCRFIWIYFPISATLGRFLFRLRQMVTKDFVQFLRLALLFIVSYGIAIHAVIYPDYPMSWELIRRVFHKAWFSLFLSPIDDLHGDPHCKPTQPTHYPNNTCRIGPYDDVSCPVTGPWPYIFVIVYFVILKLILITLLYALFSYTASKLEADSDAIWKYQRYYIVLDFYVRPRLPAPLNVFSFIIIFFSWLWKLLRRCSKCCARTSIQFQVLPEHEIERNDPAEDYYWKELSEEYLEEKEKKESESHLLKRQSDKNDLQLEMIESLKCSLKQNEVRLSELEKILQIIRVSQEQIKHSILKKEETFLGVKCHFLARQPTYPDTNITRFQLPDKYVDWSCGHNVYDPVSYTELKEKFPNDVKLLIDDSLTRGVFSRHFKWNQVYRDENGILIDRRSWIVQDNGQAFNYKLDAEGLPINPVGRTGLTGRGGLYRWGPNHTIILVISRWHTDEIYIRRSLTSLEEQKRLEFVVSRRSTEKVLSLPGGFEHGEESLYNVLKKVFGVNEEQQWDAETMKDYFARFAPSSGTSLAEGGLSSPPDKGISISLLFRDYLDDTRNTDNAWVEAEVWHLQYLGDQSIDIHRFKPYLQWKCWTPNIEKKMLPSHAAILHELVVNFEASNDQK